jgi:hypothetical protein
MILPSACLRAKNPQYRASTVVGPMGKIYQRYDYLNERRAALELWGETLMRIVNQQ